MDTLIAELSKYQAAMFYVFGIIGMLAHYTKKWAKGEYIGNLWAYLYADKPKASLYALLTYSGAAAAVVATGTLDAMKIGAVVALGFTTGYAIDSSVNSTAQS